MVFVILLCLIGLVCCYVLFKKENLVVKTKEEKLVVETKEPAKVNFKIVDQEIERPKFEDVHTIFMKNGNSYTFTSPKHYNCSCNQISLVTGKNPHNYGIQNDPGPYDFIREYSSFLNSTQQYSLGQTYSIDFTIEGVRHSVHSNDVQLITRSERQIGTEKLINKILVPNE